MKEFQEKELIRLLTNGDEKAFKVIFDQYYRPLTLFALKYLNQDLEQAKELTQEFFIRFWSKRHDLDIRFSLKTYLFRGVRNACLNHLESNKVRQHHLKDYNISVFTQDNALENMLAAEQEELLMKAIDALPERCREIFFLSRMDKMSNQQIADKLQLSVKTVEAQITIALKRLRDLLIAALVLLFPG